MMFLKSILTPIAGKVLAKGAEEMDNNEEIKELRILEGNLHYEFMRLEADYEGQIPCNIIRQTITKVFKDFKNARR
jgi:hypothetical protein